MHSKGLAQPQRLAYAAPAGAPRITYCFNVEKWTPAGLRSVRRRLHRRGPSTFQTESSTQLSTGVCAQPVFSLHPQALGGRSENQHERHRLSIVSVTLPS